MEVSQSGPKITKYGSPKNEKKSESQTKKDGSHTIPTTENKCSGVC